MVDATHYEGDAEKCRASAATDMDTTSEPSTLTTINRLEITISLMHAMQRPDANTNGTQLAN